MEKKYSTGTFAKLANVTERTIRYYDKIGLLKPSFVMKNGYRQYTDRDFLKLQKIISLKNLGFSISEIFPMVSEDDSNSIKNSINLQIDLINKRITHLQVLKDSLKTVGKSLSEKDINWDTIVELVRLTNRESEIVEHYKDANNLLARISLHDRFSINKQGWFPWLFDQINFNGVYRLLEIGCGNGKLWENTNINLRNREIFLSDNSDGMVEEVRKKLGDTFNCIVVDCENIPFKDGYFDAVIANHVLFYVKDLEKGLKEINRVLSKGSTFYCSTYGSNHMIEITEIVKAFDSRIQLSENRLYDRFGLENGEEILSHYFTNIEKKLYPDQLIIHEAKPLVDYIMSCHGNQNEIIGTRLLEFQNYIESLLKEKGTITITKNAGIFICKK